MDGEKLKIVDGLLNKVLETGTRKQIFVYLKSADSEPINGVLKAIDPNLNWILIESVELNDEPNICFLINFNDVSYLSYLKCNGLERNDIKLPLSEVDKRKKFSEVLSIKN